MVRAPRRVDTDCATCGAPVALVLTTVRTPSPQEANARRLPGSNPAASTPPPIDRKSTRLNSSHDQISYAVFCLKKKINDTSLTFCFAIATTPRLLVATCP